MTSPSFAPLPDWPTRLHPSLVPAVERALAEATRRPALVLPEAVAAAVAEPSARLVFICTHNSRRSHFAQVWAQVAAIVGGRTGVETFSGGTEATACHPNSVASLRRAGFVVPPPPSGASNPHYALEVGPGLPPLELFSKRWDAAPPNPAADFVAVLVCDSAAESCPFVHGARARLVWPFADPKAADGTPAEAATYDARQADIAAAMVQLVLGLGHRS